MPEPARPMPWMKPDTPARKIERVVEIDGSYVGLLEDDPKHVVVLNRTGERGFEARVVPMRWIDYGEERIG